MKQSKLYSSLFVLLAFAIAYWGVRFLYFVPDYYPVLKVVLGYMWWFIPTLFVMAFIGKGASDLYIPLGLASGFGKALVFSLLCVAPMLISSLVFGKLNLEQGFFTILHKSFLAGIMEEYLFRGFLFGMLFYVCRWGFIPAATIGALVFGAGHLYQGVSLMQAMLVFFITAMGAAWFAWLFVEWKANLWVPILMHSLMNLSWILFDISSNAIGSVLSNVFRALTIALSIIITLKLNKGSGLVLRQNRLWKWSL